MTAIDYDASSNYWSTPFISHAIHAAQQSGGLQVSPPPAAAPALVPLRSKTTTRLDTEQLETLTSSGVFGLLESFVKERNTICTVPGVAPSVLENMLDEWQHHTALQSLRINYREHNKSLTVYNPNVGHEIMAPLFSAFSHNKPSDVRLGGTAYTKLKDGGKCPDFCFYSDDDPNIKSRFCHDNGKGELIAYPTVVIEVGYSESKRDLAEDCARWIVASLARVRLAIGIDIKYSFAKDQNNETVVGSRKLITIFCYTWEIEEIKETKVLPNGEQVNILKRADSVTKGPSRRYYFFTWHDGELFRLQAYNRIKARVYPKKAPETVDAILIQRKHVYRSNPTPPDDHNDLIFKLTFDKIREATEEMHEMQVLADFAFDRKRKSGDSQKEERKPQRVKTNMLNLKSGLAKNKDDAVVYDDDE